ncbi:MAG: DUF167 domain-containing protein [Candidatus Lokiarchaeota archaeon]|nr:DUF167 domain-containing protein [Candidatus Lokiarchaeota archaeon]
MSFLDVKTKTVYHLRVKIKPNSRRQEIFPCSETDSWLPIHLKSKPVKNKANKELLNLVKHRLNISSDQILILSGLNKTNKVLEIRFNENIEKAELMKKLFN